MPKATVTPIKVDAPTDDLIAHAAHFLSTTKKEVVERAVREFVGTHREEINAGVRRALAQLDGSNASAVALMTGMSIAELDDLGGVPEK